MEVCGKVFFYDARVIPPLSLQLSCALFDGDVFPDDFPPLDFFSFVSLM